MTCFSAEDKKWQWDQIAKEFKRKSRIQMQCWPHLCQQTVLSKAQGTLVSTQLVDDWGLQWQTVHTMSLWNLHKHYGNKWTLHKWKQTLSWASSTKRLIKHTHWQRLKVSPESDKDLLWKKRQVQWLMAILPVTWKAEIRGSQVHSQPGQPTRPCQQMNI